MRLSGIFLLHHEVASLQTRFLLRCGEHKVELRVTLADENFVSFISAFQSRPFYMIVGAVGATYCSVHDLSYLISLYLDTLFLLIVA